MVCNASNRPKVLAQLERHRGGLDARLIDRTLDTAMIAVQGPAALADRSSAIFDAPLDRRALLPLRRPGTFLGGRGRGQPDRLHRRGRLRADRRRRRRPRRPGRPCWTPAGSSGSCPCGLGARDTLRFEAAMPLYGHEMDETVNPYAAGLGLGRQARQGRLRRPRRPPRVQGRPRPGPGRPGARRQADRPPGVPGLARRRGRRRRHLGDVRADPRPEPGDGPGRPDVGRGSAPRLTVDVRGHDEPARVVPLPFYRRPPSPA